MTTMTSLIPLPSLALDVGGLIYLIIIVIWIISRMKASKREQSGEDMPESPRPANMPPLNDEIREMLETLTGQKIERPQAPTPPELREMVESELPTPPPMPQRTRQPAGRFQNTRQNRLERKLADARARAEAHKRRVEQAQAERVRVSQAPPLQPEPEYSQPAEVTATIASPGATMSMRTITTRITPIKLPTIRMGLSSGMMRESGCPIVESAQLHDRDTLRRAIVSQIILGPPKALETSTDRF